VQGERFGIHPGNIRKLFRRWQHPAHIAAINIRQH